MIVFRETIRTPFQQHDFKSIARVLRHRESSEIKDTQTGNRQALAPPREFYGKDPTKTARPARKEQKGPLCQLAISRKNLK